MFYHLTGKYMYLYCVNIVQDHTGDIGINLGIRMYNNVDPTWPRWLGLVSEIKCITTRYFMCSFWKYCMSDNVSKLVFEDVFFFNFYDAWMCLHMYLSSAVRRAGAMCIFHNHASSAIKEIFRRQPFKISKVILFEMYIYRSQKVYEIYI